MMKSLLFCPNTWFWRILNLLCSYHSQSGISEEKESGAVFICHPFHTREFLVEDNLNNVEEFLIQRTSNCSLSKDFV